jgi:hypothetical protein
MSKSKSGIMLISMLSILAVVSTAAAEDLSIENKVTSPADKTIWTTSSEKNPKEATVALTITNLVDNSARTPLDPDLPII